MKRLTLALTVALALGGSAQAVILPGGYTSLGGTTTAASPQLAGTVLEDDVVPFTFSSAGGTVFGTVQSRVVRSTLDGTLDFYWRIISNANSADTITQFRLANFVAPLYSGDYATDGLGDIGPDAAFKFPGPGVNFVFGHDGGSELAAGMSSYFFFLDTSANSYNRSAFYDLTTHSDISASFSTFAPTAFVPEPGTSALVAGGIALLGLGRRRRQG